MTSVIPTSQFVNSNTANTNT